MKFSLIRNPLLGPKPGDDVNAFFEARSALFHADAEDVELLWDEGASKSSIEPAVADIIEHRQLAGELDGMVECGYHGAGDQPDASGAGRWGGGRGGGGCGGWGGGGAGRAEKRKMGWGLGPP